MAANKGFVTSCCLYLTIRGIAGMFSQCYTQYTMKLLILFHCIFPFHSFLSEVTPFILAVTVILCFIFLFSCSCPKQCQMKINVRTCALSELPELSQCINEIHPMMK